MKTNNLYNKLQEDEQLISEDSSNQWDERLKRLLAHCIIHTNLMTLMM